VIIIIFLNKKLFSKITPKGTEDLTTPRYLLHSTLYPRFTTHTLQLTPLIINTVNIIPIHNQWTYVGNNILLYYTIYR